MSYATVEERGIALPITEATVRYRRPLRYDDLALVRVGISQWRGASVCFAYEVYAEDRTTLHATGSTRHACVDPAGRPVRIPGWLRACSRNPEPRPGPGCALHHPMHHRPRRCIFCRHARPAPASRRPAPSGMAPRRSHGPQPLLRKQCPIFALFSFPYFLFSPNTLPMSPNVFNYRISVSGHAMRKFFSRLLAALAPRPPPRLRHARPGPAHACWGTATAAASPAGTAPGSWASAPPRGRVPPRHQLRPLRRARLLDPGRHRRPPPGRGRRMRRLRHCMGCEFFKTVRREEGGGFKVGL